MAEYYPNTHGNATSLQWVAGQQLPPEVRGPTAPSPVFARGLRLKAKQQQPPGPGSRWDLQVGYDGASEFYRILENRGRQLSVLHQRKSRPAVFLGEAWSMTRVKSRSRL